MKSVQPSLRSISRDAVRRRISATEYLIDAGHRKSGIGARIKTSQY